MPTSKLRRIRSDWSTIGLGLLVGSLLAGALLFIDEDDDRTLTAFAFGGGAGVVALLGWVLGHRSGFVMRFASACAGLAAGIALILPLDQTRVAWTLRADKRYLESLRVELNERVRRGEPLPAMDEVATSGDWGRSGKLGGRLLYQRKSDRDFELIVGEYRNRLSPWGIHRLDSATGDWRYEDKPLLLVHFEK